MCIGVVLVTISCSIICLLNLLRSFAFLPLYFNKFIFFKSCIHVYLILLKISWKPRKTENTIHPMSVKIRLFSLCFARNTGSREQLLDRYDSFTSSEVINHIRYAGFTRTSTVKISMNGN